MVARRGVWEHGAMRPRLTRLRDGRVIAGVAAGLGAHLGVDPLVVRLAFVVLTFAGGAGIVFYVLAWLVLLSAVDGPSIAQRVTVDGRSASQAVSVGLIVLGALFGLRATGPWFDDSVVWPVTLASVGLVVIWRQAGAGDLRWRRSGLLRVVAGMALVIVGMGVFLASHDAFSAVGPALVAVAVIVGGVALLFAPWWWRLGTELAEERRARVRSQERAEVAAHLHDSVLQTLALIQRHAGDPASVQHLARRQEAELRSWLYGRLPVGDGDSLDAALEGAAREVEDLHGIVVDVVTVGDCPLDDRLSALVAAAREAMVNAAKWSGQPQVAVYAETEAHRVSVFVRDRGVGFDVDAVAPDRHGISQSIVGRMARNGGTATMRSSAEGTEVCLEMQRAPA